VINLDTRYNRDDHFIPSIGGSRVPFAALGAAFIRMLTATFGIGADYDGTILGDKQSDWFRNELCAERYTVTVIVSSIQVLTSNPVVESWGHYPEARRNFLDTIGQKCEGERVLLLSGDVHHAEFSGGGGLVEVTSSGLTHR